MALRICSLFSGIGGFELGLASSGHFPVLFCEIDPVAQSILSHNFPGVPIIDDVRKLERLPKSDLLVAGWPCQDLSQAGRLRGLQGQQSSLVTEIFRLLKSSKDRPRYVLLENVAFALHVESGAVTSYVTSELEKLGYNWCYRILDAQFFGKPQRRRRLYILADLEGDPSHVLFREANNRRASSKPEMEKFGFYWTEGNTGLGWSPECVPPLKGGSGLSIPSPPAIWLKSEGTFIVPGIVDAERLQGFPVNWTALSRSGSKQTSRHKWTLLGNAVNVAVVRWIGRGLEVSGCSSIYVDMASKRRANAGLGGPRQESIHFHTVSEGPNTEAKTLSEFGLFNPSPLSKRAASGFMNRLANSRLNFHGQFLDDLRFFVSKN